MSRAGLACALAAVLGSASMGAHALAQTQAPASTVHKTTLQTQAFPGTVYDTVTVRALVDHGGIVARHTHPGIEMAYIVSGEALVKIMGRPDQTYKAGDTFAVPPQTPHSVRNVGPGALTIISTYVVDKSKPIATPDPLPS